MAYFAVSSIPLLREGGREKKKKDLRETMTSSGTRSAPTKNLARVVRDVYRILVCCLLDPALPPARGRLSSTWRSQTTCKSILVSIVAIFFFLKNIVSFFFSKAINFLTYKIIWFACKIPSFCSILIFSCIKGGGDDSEGEVIEIVELSIPEIKDYIKSKEVQSPASFLFGVSWFLLNKSEYCS